MVSVNVGGMPATTSGIRDNSPDLVNNNNNNNNDNGVTDLVPEVPR